MIRLLPILVLLAACGKTRGGTQFGSEDTGCVPFAGTVDADSAAYTGFSANEILPASGVSTLLQFSDGRQGGTITAKVDGLRTNVEAHNDCEETWLTFGAHLTFRSDDGEFDEDWNVDVRADNERTTFTGTGLQISNGTYTPPGAPTAFSLDVEGEVSGGGSSGTLTVLTPGGDVLDSATWQ